MAELYILSQDEHYLTTLSEDTGLISTWFKDHLNRVPDKPFIFTIEADVEGAEHVVEENQVVFKDKEGDLRLYVIKEIDDIDNINGPQTVATCEPSFMENKERIIVERRFDNQTANVALNAALEPTRWEGIVEVELGTATTNFYYISSVDAVWKIIKVWGGEFKDVVEFDGTRITRRVIKLVQRRGSDRGKRFEIDHDIEEIQRTVLSYPVTAIYGRGASLETDGGGYTRYIDFADVEWKKSAGDPVDKLLGQKWVGDPEALQKYGRLHKGQLMHREGIWQNSDYEDPHELLLASWEQLQQVKKPEVNYRLSVHLFEMIAGYEHEKAELGDTAVAIDRKFSRPIELQARVIAIEYDLLDIEGTAVVEMGQFLSIYDEDSKVDRVIEEIRDNRGKWENISNDRFPNKIPSVPANVDIVGGFQQIQLYWEFNTEIFVSHYEVYGSQVKGFIPDSQHLLYRGRLNGYLHKVETDQVWYYRIRAVNHHGRASEFTVEFSGKTLRIITEDLLFDPATREQLEQLEQEAQRLANEARDDAKQEAKIYTDQEVEEKRTQLMEEIAEKADLEYVNGQLVLKADSSVVSSISDTVDDLNSTANSLLQKVAENEDALATHDGRITSITQEIDTIEGTLSITIDELSSLNGVVQNQQTQINANANEISLKASQDQVDTISGQISSINSELSVQAGQIALKAEQSSVEELENDLTSVSSSLSSLIVDVNGISTSVSSVQAELDNLQIGGRNLIPDSRDEWDTGGRLASGSAYNIYKENLSNIYKDLVGEEIVISFDVRIDTTDGTSGRVQVYGSNGSPRYRLNSRTIQGINSEWQRVSTTIDITEMPNNSGQGRIEFWGHDSKTVRIYIRNLKLERGNKATDWTPAPEDVDGKIDNVESRVTSAESTLTQQAGMIEARVTKTAYETDQNGIVSRLDSAESTITQHANLIESKVSQVDFNAVEGRVSSAESTISQHSNQIQQRVTQTEFNNGIAGAIRYTDETTGNLVNNPTATSTAGGWSTTTMVNQDFFGTTVPVIQSSVSSNTQHYSDYFKVDPSKAYEVSVWIKKSANVGRVYLGLNGLNSSGSTVGFERVSTAGTLASHNDTNFYFYTVDHAPTDWMKIVGYIMPTGTDNSAMAGIGENVNGGNARMKANTDRIRVRFLNWNNDTTRQVWVANAKVQEVDPLSVIRSANAQIRISTAESTITQLADQIELRVEKDGVVSSINQTAETIKINANRLNFGNGALEVSNGNVLIKSLAVGTGAIANGAITNAKLGTAVVDTLQVKDGAITNAKIASLSADKVNAGTLRAITIDGVTIRGTEFIGGTLRSMNNNVIMNLNQGRIDVYSGGQINFLDPGNGIKYVTGSHSAGMITSTTASQNLPMVAIGTDSGSGVINANSSDFMGIRVHTRASGNRMSFIGGRYIFSTRPDFSTAAFVINTDGDDGTRSIYPWNSSSYDYDIGREASQFNNVYTRNIRASENVHIRDAYSSGGWLLETRAAAGATTMTLRGINTNTWNYNLGASGWRINRIFLSNSPDVSSDQRLKEDISSNELGLAFINDIETKQFRLKQTAADLIKNPIQFGVIAQQLRDTLINHGVDIDDCNILSIGENGMYGVQYEQLIAPLINSVQELDAYTKDKINWLKMENQLLRARVKQLELKIA